MPASPTVTLPELVQAEPVPVTDTAPVEPDENPMVPAALVTVPPFWTIIMPEAAHQKSCDRKLVS